jgi:hypothetical protein
MSLNIPPARRVTPPPLPDLLSAASTRSPLPRTRSKISQGCYEGAGGSSASGSSGNGNSRNSSNVSSCSLDAMSSSSDDDIWGYNGRCKALHFPLQQSCTSFTTNQHPHSIIIPSCIQFAYPASHSAAGSVSLWPSMQAPLHRVVRPPLPAACRRFPSSQDSFQAAAAAAQSGESFACFDY